MSFALKVSNRNGKEKLKTLKPISDYYYLGTMIEYKCRQRNNTDNEKYESHTAHAATLSFLKNRSQKKLKRRSIKKW